MNPYKPAVVPFLQPQAAYGTGKANREILDYNRDRRADIRAPE
jgi:hypothetical protein